MHIYNSSNPRISLAPAAPIWQNLNLAAIFNASARYNIIIFGEFRLFENDCLAGTQCCALLVTACLKSIDLYA